MKVSYNTLTSDIKSFIKQTWTTHVPFAVLLAIVLYFLLPNKSLHDWGVVNPMASFILQTIIYLATIVMAVISFWHLMPRKQLCAKGEKRKIGKSLIRILRHFGGFFMTCFLGIMIVGIATFIAALPSIILIIAQFYSQLGALDGDPLGTTPMADPALCRAVLEGARERGVETVLTGRCPEGLAALADYVSEIRSVRHPFERGVPARAGVEF